MRVRTGDTENITAYVLQSNGTPAIGRTTIRLRILRLSDNLYFDFSDSTFKSAGWTTLDAVMSEIDSINSPGIYNLPGGFNTGLITNFSPNDDYVLIVTQTSGNDLLPPPGEINMGDWADTLDIAISTRATPGDVDVSVFESEPDLR